MWLVTILCSADSWRTHAIAFNAIAAQHAAKPISTKKMKDDERRIMTYQVEDPGAAEEFQQACLRIEGFSAIFEAM
jgi:hypothetical protein